MIRKTLQAVPLDTGNRWAAYVLFGIVGSFAGWILHPVATCSGWFAV